MARTVKPLNDTQLKNAKAKEKDYKLSDGEGLYFVVKKNGTKSWRYDFSYGGKRKSMSFGIYPTVSLKDARTKKDEAKYSLANNVNPISIKKAKKTSETITLSDVIEDWLKLRKKSKSEATITQNKRILKNITIWLGNIAIKDIRRIDIINALQKYQEKGVIESAHRLLALVNKIYMYAVTNEYVEHNIIADIDKKSILVPNKKDAHLPALIEPKDIKQLLIDINSISEKYRSDISTIFIFKLLPYVFVRSENIRLMRWNELNLEEGYWAIPKEKMKMNIEFVCPLPHQAVKLIKEIEPYSRHRSEFVFPSPQKSDRGVSGATLSDTLVRLGYQNRHTVHGFRSMFSTTAHNLYKEHGFHSDIIESCLAHKERNRVKASYNRESKFKYYEEKKELIQWYANWLDNL
ncbi:integrase [Arcobacter sp. F155]|uniref:tyrosine-type recombinase/integrase n=1 Tax=Arcobacter sp. F155 TaxID=2044512 RepID=UPI00100B610B|nr:integrase arm-type DNA-binding domain-containing protein [Arcobacter sp. F155]RXJ76592.1 integrase [Arcobacter sp. F155]